MKCRATDEKPLPTLEIQDPAGRLQLIVSLASAGNRTDVLAEARNLADNHVAARAWRLLSEVNANMQRRVEARQGPEIALQHDPETFPLSCLKG